MRNDVSIIDVLHPDVIKVSPDCDGPAIIVNINEVILDNKIVTASEISKILKMIDLTDPESLHRVILSSYEDCIVSHEDLISLKTEFHMKLLGILQDIEITEEEKNTSNYLIVDMLDTKTREGEIAGFPSVKGNILAFEPIYTKREPATIDTAHIFFDTPLHKGRPIKNLAAFAKGPIPKNIEQNQDLLRKAWRIAAENVWNPLPDEVTKIFKIGDKEEVEKEMNMEEMYSKNQIGWFNLPHVTADRFAGRLINAPYGSTIWTGSISHGLRQLLSCSEVMQKDRSTILCTNEDFSGIKHSTKLYTQYDTGKKVKTIEAKHGNQFHLEAYLDSLNEDVSMAILPHIGFKNGERIPDEELKIVADRCKEKGIFFAIDGAHAIGDRFVDVTQIQPNAYLSTLMKEGCGSAGSAFMYLDPKIDLHPTLTSWLGSANPFAHKNKYEPASNVRQRFYGGTPTISTYYQCIEGARIYIETGFQEVEADLQRKIEDAINILLEGGTNIISPTNKRNRSQLIVLEINNNPFEIAEELLEEYGIRVYPNTIQGKNIIRLSPHICCPHEESNEACAIIAKTINKHL